SFFRILPRPLSSTLFPYTTLFRSLELLGATDLAAIGDGIVLDAAHFNLRALFDGDVSAPPDDVHNAKYLCHGLRSLPLDLEFQRTGEHHQIADDVDLLSAFEAVLVAGRTLESALFDGGLNILYPDQIAIAAAAARPGGMHAARRDNR